MITWFEELGIYLQIHGIGVVGTDIFFQNFDSSTTNSIVLIAQAGQASKTTLRNTMTLKRPELGIRVRDLDDSTAHTKAEAIYDLLNHTYNTSLGSTRFKSIKAIAEPFFVSQSKNGSFIYSINFSLEIENLTVNAPMVEFIDGGTP